MARGLRIARTREAMDVIDTEIQDFWVDRSDTTCWTSFQIALSKLWLECPEARDDIDRLRAYVAGLKPSEFGMDADRTMVTTSSRAFAIQPANPITRTRNDGRGPPGGFCNAACGSRPLGLRNPSSVPLRDGPTLEGKGELGPGDPATPPVVSRRGT